MKMESAALQRIPEMKKFTRLLLQIDIEDVPDIQNDIEQAFNKCK